MRAAIVWGCLVTFVACGSLSAQTPSNDECSSAIPIGNGLTAGTNAGATTSAQSSPCVNIGADVWYLYVAPCTGMAEATFCQPGNASFDTVLAVFDGAGTCVAPTLIDCNDDTCLFKSRVLFTATVGHPYLIAVGGFAGNQGTFGLSVSCHQPPPEDDCAGAIPVALGTNGPFSNQFATDGVPPASSCALGFADLWFAFTPPCSGSYLIATCGSYDTVLSVRTACAGAEIACNDDGPGPCAPGSEAQVAATAGATYLVRVAGATAAGGSFTIAISRVFVLSYDSPFGPGSVGFALGGAYPNGLYLNAITFTAGAFPNGSFYGIDLTPAELQNVINLGYPFVGTPDGCGDSTFLPVLAPFLSGLTLYSVGLSTDATFQLPVLSTAAVAYPIP